MRIWTFYCILFLLLLAGVSSCYGGYADVLRPLQTMDIECRCRFEALARHYYQCQYYAFRDLGDNPKAAHTNAVAATHRMVARIQLNMEPHQWSKMCNCIDLRDRGMY